MSKTKAPVLKDIQETMYTLWTRREERAKFLGGEASPGVHKELVAGTCKRGVKLYASMIEIGRLDLMTSLYPSIEKLLKKKFREIVLDYFETVPPSHFNLNSSGREFSRFLAGNEKLMASYPFLAELADFEWQEMEVLERESQAPAPVANASAGLSVSELEASDFVNLAPVINPVLVARSYRYPVSDICEKLMNGEKLPRRVKLDKTFVLIFRSLEDAGSCFLQIGELAYEIVLELQKHPGKTYGDLIAYAASSSGGDPQEVVSEFLEMIEHFKENGVILP